MKSARRLLLVHAHPDDETINNGATMAKYVAEGAGVTLVTCTRGEEGEVLVPELAHYAAGATDQLGPHRETELADAMSALGVTDFRFLGAPSKKWRDSGMMGTEPTYDEFGGYGHPDHIQAHRVAMRAAELAADPAYNNGISWEIEKIYWNITPRSVIEAGMAKMKEMGSDFFGAESVDDLPFVKPDELVTALIDGTPFIERKMAAMRAHPTQIALDGPFFALSNNLGNQVWGHEYYTLVKGVKSEPLDELGRESDLFAGVVQP